MTGIIQLYYSAGLNPNAKIIAKNIIMNVKAWTRFAVRTIMKKSTILIIGAYIMMRQCITNSSIPVPARVITGKKRG